MITDDTLRDEEESTQPSSSIEPLDVVNLDEITTSSVRVAIRDVRLVPAFDEEGNPIIDMGKQKTRRQYYTRIAEIENYVPMSVFNKMMATRRAVLHRRQEYLENPTDESGDPLIPWMTQQVLAVWKLTEEDMTLQRLEDGLDFEKVSRLFTLFFNHLFPTNAR